MTTQSQIHIDQVRSILATHLPLYQRRPPVYQTLMLESLRSVWSGRHRNLLDIGGGTGVIGEAMSKLLPVGEVEAVDLVDRFCPTLSIRTRQYDGSTLPFADGYFDAATMNNVLHHVDKLGRGSLLREVQRVVRGPLYIKDHKSAGRIDNARLTVLDAIGNIPFGGMVKAEYLDAAEWQQLAAESGYRIAAQAETLPYRKGVQAMLFPNRLETTMRFELI